jgi:hypothetical protein
MKRIPEPSCTHDYIWILKCPTCNEIRLEKSQTRTRYQPIKQLRRIYRFFGECESCQDKRRVAVYRGMIGEHKGHL